MRGPFPIVCRGHSGSRLLSELYTRNRIWMGIRDNLQRDSQGFGQGNRSIGRLIRAAFDYPDLPEDRRLELRRTVREVVEESRDRCPAPGVMLGYGWKRPITIFASEIFMDEFPEARMVHLIRDGRDVMLSRLDHRMNGFQSELNRLTIFGDAGVMEYRGRKLDRAVVEEFRNELEMQHWVTAVRFGMRARRYGDRYLEVRYEDLCERPDVTLAEVFEFLAVPFLKESRAWAMQNASTVSIGKWRGRDDELAEAIALGKPLLQELGYC
jgi:hypothetical protein